MNISNLISHINNINDKNKYILEKTIPKTKFKLFKQIILSSIKATKTIIKGSQSLNILLNKKIFTNEDDILYKDIDCVTKDIDKLLKLICKKAQEKNINKYITIIQNQYKTSIYIVKFFNISFVDIHTCEKKLYDIYPIVAKNNILYIEPSYMKIDLYNILSTPIIYNINLIEKTLDRIHLIETDYPYANNIIKTSNDLTNNSANNSANNLPNNIKIIKKIINNLKYKFILTGFIGYYHTHKKINVPYLELFSTNPYKEIENLKLILNITNVDTYDGYGFNLSKFYRIYINNKPLIYLYTLIDCKSYIIKNNLFISNNYLLLFYFNIKIYLNKYYNNIYNVSDNQIYYLLDNIYKSKLIYSTLCIGNLQPGILELLNNKTNNNTNNKINNNISC